MILRTSKDTNFINSNFKNFSIKAIKNNYALQFKNKNNKIETSILKIGIKKIPKYYSFEINNINLIILLFNSTSIVLQRVFNRNIYLLKKINNNFLKIDIEKIDTNDKIVMYDIEKRKIYYDYLIERKTIEPNKKIKMMKHFIYSNNQGHILNKILFL